MKFKEMFIEKQYFVSLDIECPGCFDGNIAKEAKKLNIKITKIKGKGVADAHIEGARINVIELLQRMGVNKKDLQLYINYWDKD